MFARRASSFALFALLCAITAYWIMTLSAPRPVIVPAPPPAPTAASFDSALHARLFGGATTGSQASNIRVVGVIAPANEGDTGIALLAVDNKPVRPYASGQSIGDGATLGTVRRDRIIVDQGGAAIELPVPQTQAGVSTAGGGGSASGAGMPGGNTAGTARVLQGGVPQQSQQPYMSPRPAPTPSPNQAPGSERLGVSPDDVPPTPNPGRRPEAM